LTAVISRRASSPVEWRQFDAVIAATNPSTPDPDPTPSISSFSKGKIMTGNGKYVSLYDQRVKLVADALTAHSKLNGKAATELAVHVLYALDHIPERVRYSGK
jgi:Family of unknown function (DUF6307)